MKRKNLIPKGWASQSWGPPPQGGGPHDWDDRLPIINCQVFFPGGCRKRICYEGGVWCLSGLPCREHRDAPGRRLRTLFFQPTHPSPRPGLPQNVFPFKIHSKTCMYFQLRPPDPIDGFRGRKTDFIFNPPPSPRQPSGSRKPFFQRGVIF